MWRRKNSTLATAVALVSLNVLGNRRQTTQRPAVDGEVYLRDADVAVGDFVKAKIVEADTFDLGAEVVE